MTFEQQKWQVAEFATKLVQSGMKIGLGTGSTASCFIQTLAERCTKENLTITTCATSKESHALAHKVGLKCVSIDEIGIIDMTFDGADEVDSSKNLIKGAGGALLREKVVAYYSNELVIMIDESKLVNKLGEKILPVEVVPFGHTRTKKSIEALGFSCQLRKNEEATPFITDNNNYIYDLKLAGNLQDPALLERRLTEIPGVVETGFFLGYAQKILIGTSDGKVRTLT